MDPITATTLLIASLRQLAEFGVTIAKARAEGRDLTVAEVAAASAGTKAALDALDAKIKAAGG